MADHNEQQPNAQEMAALELYHQLVNLSPDNGDRALLISVRLPNARHVGDVWLSAADVEQLIDGALTIAQHRIAYGDPAPAAAPLPVDEDDDEAIAAIGDEAEAFLRNGGQC